MVRWLQFCKCFSWIIQQSINKDGIDKVRVTEAGRPIVIEVELWWSSPSWASPLWHQSCGGCGQSCEYHNSLLENIALPPLLSLSLSKRAKLLLPVLVALTCYWQRRDVENCDNWYLQVDRWNHYIWRLVISINFIHNRDHPKALVTSLQKGIMTSHFHYFHQIAESSHFHR